MDTSQNTNTFDNSLHTSAEFSKKFTRELAKNLTKVSNNPSKLRDNFICLTHSPNHLLLSKNIKPPLQLVQKLRKFLPFKRNPPKSQFVTHKTTLKSVRTSVPLNTSLVVSLQATKKSTKLARFPLRKLPKLIRKPTKRTFYQK